MEGRNRCGKCKLPICWWMWLWRYVVCGLLLVESNRRHSSLRSNMALWQKMLQYVMVRTNTNLSGHIFSSRHKTELSFHFVPVIQDSCTIRKWITMIHHIITVYKGIMTTYHNVLNTFLQLLKFRTYFVYTRNIECYWHQCLDLAMAQAVKRRPSAVVRVWYQPSPYVICSGHRGTGIGFYLNTSILPLTGWFQQCVILISHLFVADAATGSVLK